jgi:hypothetical protein
MVIQPAGWPLGEARVTVEARRRGDDSVVRITEQAVRGPGSWIPAMALDVLLHTRNVETLRRLSLIAENRGLPPPRPRRPPGADPRR